MTAFIIYIIKWTFALTLLYSLYGLFLRRETFHRINRMVLLFILLSSMVLPFCNIELEHSNPITEGAQRLEQVVKEEAERKPLYMTQARMDIDEDKVAGAYDAHPSMAATPHDEAEDESSSSSFPWMKALLGIYLLGFILYMLRYLCDFVLLTRMIYRGKRVRVEGIAERYRVIVTPRAVMPMSWMRWILVNEQDLHEPCLLQHELAHLRKGHSWDLLLSELTARLQWFNPLAWMLCHDLRDIHEYEVDRELVSEGTDREAYSRIIIDRGTHPALQSVTNGLKHSLIKDRLKMLYTKPSGRLAWLKVLYLVPLVGLAIIAFAQPNLIEDLTDQLNEWRNPRGIYKLMTIENQVERVPAPFDQYKICTPKATLMLTVTSINDSPGWFHISDNDHIIFNYTGEKPDKENPTATRIYDSDKEHFTLKWWSTEGNHAYFPENDWCTEYYEANQFSVEGKAVFEALNSIPKYDKNHPLNGRWDYMESCYSMAEARELVKSGIKVNLDYASLIFLPNDTLVSFNQLLMAGQARCITTDGKTYHTDGDMRYKIHWVTPNHMVRENQWGYFSIYHRALPQTTTFIEKIINDISSPQAEVSKLNLIGAWQQTKLGSNSTPYDDYYITIRVYIPDNIYAQAGISRNEDGSYTIHPHEIGGFSFENGKYMERGLTPEVEMMDKDTFVINWPAGDPQETWSRVLPEISNELMHYIAGKCISGEETPVPEHIQKQIRRYFPFGLSDEECK